MPADNCRTAIVRLYGVICLTPVSCVTVMFAGVACQGQSLRLPSAATVSLRLGHTRAQHYPRAASLPLHNGGVVRGYRLFGALPVLFAGYRRYNRPAVDCDMFSHSLERDISSRSFGCDIFILQSRINAIYQATWLDVNVCSALQRKRYEASSAGQPNALKVSVPSTGLFSLCTA